MGVYEDLVAWSEGRPTWQRDALRRLAQQGALSEQDITDITEIALVAAGAPGVTHAADPFAATHVPAAGPSGVSVELVAVANPSNVNALAPGARLDFEPTGITIVYGDNGSGKSGYVRILKRVCRARSTPTRVLPNVLSRDPTPTAADIQFQVGGVVQNRRWVVDDTTVDELGAVTVFDRDCAAVYVNSENEVAYRPLGLDLLDSLGSAARAVRTRLERARDAARPRLAGPPSDAVGGSILEGIWPLNPDVAPSAIEMLPAWDEARQGTLRETERALATPTPLETAAGLRTQLGLLQRASALARRADAELTMLARLPEARERLQEAEAALADVRVAATRPADLSGVESPLWRALWSAASSFSTEVAYVGHEYPFLGENARCVLCGQALSEEAEDRFRRLAEAVTTEVEVILTETRGDVTRLEGVAVGLQVKETGLALAEGLRETDPEAADRLQAVLDYAAAQAETFANGGEGEPPSGGAPDAEQTSAWLQERGGPLAARAELLTRAADPGQVERLQTEACDLRARKWIAENRVELLADVDRVLLQAAITRAAAACDTQPITMESGQLTSRYVTEALRVDFARELEALSSSRVRVRIMPRGQYGAVYHRLELDGAVVDNTRVADVVSEGEFLAIAIASFFAELGQSESRSGIVLDDPVTSLDHLNRERVAERIAQEASVRQVVVFTHDLVFLHDLAVAAEAIGVTLGYRRLRLTPTHTGRALREPPWLGMKVRQRAEVLQEELNRLRAVREAGDIEGYERDARAWYGSLRETWERAVEEILFVDAIGRYRHEVKTTCLTTERVWVIEEEDVVVLTAGMTKSSAWIRGHDQPAAVNRPVPLPDELRDDLASLRDWAASLRRRRQAATHS